ncbi:Alpha-ketoglutarate-dependent sulfonate dioxygenase [Wickerhamomyces ciferrii]|uniref:Alpha-ketoglutarate-dependent sulfonate dioxygenase n=1 Tax=Wickerhamomyces ciferrii (strain ATCC 14091 / BCRC 22168 / CBS 111 / JCM 3599 / NBRC 0793 / NRRL Y-1031 F-60-10) TaxID=1206466 RepID=K0KT51_WICCF|nr:Alpha-ketoglutarate-dependent sulfonate dioxygenase [Wickerhamomyces ciferrii]CCH44549.1 Alpha-ketoglutarate-dependent sulfonate dioxygenase [Wickerhamomyces ciferrii]
MAPPTATSTVQITQDIKKLEVSNNQEQKPEKQVKSKYDTDNVGKYKSPFYSARVEGEDGLLVLKNIERGDLSYPEYEPTWDTKTKFEPYELFEIKDRGLFADKSYKNLLSKDNKDLQTSDLTPKFGTEIKGVQLSELSDAAKDELALLTAERGVLVFRDQDLASKGVEFNVKFAEYFGPLHIHPASGAPKGYPELHLVYRSKDASATESFLKRHTTSVAWHSDVSYEKQPLGTTFLGLLDGPTSGGDTAFVDTQAAYDRLSPEFQQIIERLTAEHSGFEQAEASLRSGGITRRDPVKNIHPVVRTHPVTGKKAIYVNQQFTRDIQELKVEESDAILGFLYNFLSTSIDLQIRAKWEKGTVVVWDNRRASHSALYDWETTERRHLYRLGPRAEKPFLKK